MPLPVRNRLFIIMSKIIGATGTEFVESLNKFHFENVKYIYLDLFQVTLRSRITSITRKNFRYTNKEMYDALKYFSYKLLCTSVKKTTFVSYRRIRMAETGITFSSVKDTERYHEGLKPVNCNSEEIVRPFRIQDTALSLKCCFGGFVAAVIILFLEVIWIKFQARNATKLTPHLISHSYLI
jgi:hypothetical protein